MIFTAKSTQAFSPSLFSFLLPRHSDPGRAFRGLAAGQQPGCGFQTFYFMT
jgi:hypothetical protein